MGVIRRFIRTTLLLLVLVGVVGGVPMGLYTFFGSSLPDSVPAFADLKVWLESARLFPTQALTDIFVWAAWALWALFTAQIAVQTPAVLADTARCLRTGVMLPTVDSGNLATRLLSAIAISFIAAKGTIGVAAAATGPLPTQVAAPQPMTVATASTSQVHVVAAGENLWSIAERHLGDGERWSEIFDLNRHRVQADGQALTDPNMIRPGWRLLLPHVPTHTASRPESGPTHAAVGAGTAHAATPPRTGPTPVEATRVSAPTEATARHDTPANTPRPVVHRRVAVDLPTGGYVSVTLGAGFAAALAAARIRTRVRPRRHQPGDPHPATPRLGNSGSALVEAAEALGFHDPDPYVDMPTDLEEQTVPPVLNQLRAPEAVYIGIREGRPISIDAAASDGLTLLGGGASDTARALLLSCLTAGGYLASSATFPAVTTKADLCALLGNGAATRHVEHLTVYATFTEAVEAANDMSAAGRCLLLATPDAGSPSTLPHVFSVHLGSARTRYPSTIVTVDDALTISASDVAGAALDGATAYHLDVSEAFELFSRLPLRWTELDTDEASWPGSSTASVPESQEPADAVPIPPQASHAKPAASEAITINILGPVQILYDDRDVTVDFRVQLTALLAYLVLHRAGVPRAAVAGDLWPDSPPDKGKTLLTTALSHARTALTTVYGSRPDFFPKDRTVGIVYLGPKYFDADVWRFDALTGNRPGTDTDRIAALSAAIALYRGEVGYGIEHANKLTAPYESWLRPVREEYWRRVIDAHQSLADLLRAPDPEQALDVLDRAIRIEPWNERLYKGSMEIHLDLGQRHAAERRFRELSDLLAALGTKPSASTARMIRAPARQPLPSPALNG